MNSDLEQKERQDYVLNTLGREDWIEVYRFESGPNSVTFWCALLDSNKVPTQLEMPDWEFHIGSGLPGHIVYGFNETRVEYFRYGNDDGFQPLVHPRSFGKKKPGFIELSEEFRLLYNLHPALDGKSFSKFHDNGMEEEVVRIHGQSVKIKLRLLRTFLAVKSMHLAVFFEMDAAGDRTLEQKELDQIAKAVRTDSVSYDLWAWNRQFISDGATPSRSRIMGKKFIAPFAKSECGVFPYNEKRLQYAEFIIAIDDEGKEMMAACNADERPFLTPVFFHREVLQKYYGKPEMYSVEPGYIRCDGLWGLSIDDEHRNYVVVFLGDLGKCLPHDEQLYWKSYNVPPDGGLSRGCIQRKLLGIWTGSENPEFLFKDRFRRFQENWEKEYGWPLFRPLRDDDEHVLATLRIPLNDEQAEFDGQVQGLAKLIIDSLNEQEISKGLPTQILNEKGIAKFERYLMTHRVAAEHICKICTFMRRVYGLRHGVGHRKGESYDKSAQFFGVGQQPLRDVFVSMLSAATDLLEFLDQEFLAEKGV